MDLSVLPEPKRILLIRFKGIGDVILSTPLFRALKKKYPDAQVDLATRAICEPMVRHNPYLDHVLIYPEKPAPLSRLIGFIQRIRNEKYDWVIDLAAEPRSAWLTLFSGAILRAGYAFHYRQWAFNYRIPKNKVRKYQVEVNLDIIRALGVSDDGNQTQIFLDDTDKAWAEAVFEKREFKNLKVKLGINPTGTWSSKRWPTGHWRELIQILSAQGITPILLGAPSDQAVLDEIRKGLEDKTLLKPETTLSQAAAFVSKLDLLIGNDGTPQHFAQAFGVKSLTLCGPHWGMSWVKPHDQRHRFLQHFVDCGPCDLNVCPFPKEQGTAAHVHQECLVKIAPEKVLQVALGLLGK